MRRMSQNSQLLKIIMCRPFAHTEVKVNKILKAQLATIHTRQYNTASTVLTFNTFAASYLNTQGLNNSCLKSRQRRP